MSKINSEEFERIKVEDTKVIDSSKIKEVPENDIDDSVLRDLSIDELKYMLEYEDHTPEVVEKIKYYIRLKR